jgi:alpha-beta hydrolase superfamily lysophospholipase
LIISSGALWPWSRACQGTERPGALTDVDWEMWLAATRLAVREATRLAGDNVPLHLVGYSNGGALAMKYALDAWIPPQLRKPQQLVLLSR